MNACLIKIRCSQAGPRSDLDIVFISASVHLKERITNCGVMEIEEGIKVPN
jgi:hypothetical protein